MTDARGKSRSFLREKTQRAAVLEEMSQIAAGQADLGQARTWVTSGATLTRRAAADDPPVHLVAYAVPTAPGAVLLGLHRKAQRWLPPGGHVDPGEHPRDTARRELAEELALPWPPDPGAPLLVSWGPTVGNTPRHVDVALWYGFATDPTGNYTADPAEFSDLRWFAADALPQARDPKLSAFLKAHAA